MLFASVRCAVLCTLVGIAATPQKPDFSGMWDLAPNTTVDGNFGSVTAGALIRIEQSANAIRIRRTYGRESIKNPPVVLTISLDGKASSNPYHGVHRPGLTGAISSTARWDSARLVIVTIHTLTDAKTKKSTQTEISETLYFDGPRLVIERVFSPRSEINPARKELWFKR